MATLLEQGIIAAKKGHKAEAKALFHQVLQADDKNERAWLWMSEVADNVVEKIAYVERALALNPDNKATQLALNQLKEQITPPANPIAVAKPQSPGLLKNSSRKPFRLSEEPEPTTNDQPIHHQDTVAMSPPPHIKDLFAELRQASNGADTPANKTAEEVHPARTGDPNSIPLLPALIFGTLTITAIGGVLLFILIVLLS